LATITDPVAAMTLTPLATHESPTGTGVKPVPMTVTLVTVLGGQVFGETEVIVGFAH
jgi:hypothetical protein